MAEVTAGTRALLLKGHKPTGSRHNNCSHINLHWRTNGDLLTTTRMRILASIHSKYISTSRSDDLQPICNSLPRRHSFLRMLTTRCTSLRLNDTTIAIASWAPT